VKNNKQYDRQVNPETKHFHFKMTDGKGAVKGNILEPLNDFRTFLTPS
jgi:hypothetical protein